MGFFPSKKKTESQERVTVWTRKQRRLAARWLREEAVRSDKGTDNWRHLVNPTVGLTHAFA